MDGPGIYLSLSKLITGFGINTPLTPIDRSFDRTLRYQSEPCPNHVPTLLPKGDTFI